VDVADEAIFTRLLKHPLFRNDFEAMFAEFGNIKAGVDAASVDFLKARADIDVASLVSFFNFALDFKYLIKAHPFKALREPEKADITFLDKLKEDFHAAEKDFDGTLNAFIPQLPLYKGLMNALAFYRKIEELGGFEKVSFAGTLRKGMKSSAVKSLKERLMTEGYYSGEIDNSFDETLFDAVREYQNTHQFEINGEVDQKLLKSINVTAAQRIKSIELSLQRWRESPVKNDQPLYVRINIPEFAMELYKDGALAKKHKVVVGTNAWDKDPEQRIEGRINRTKIFKAEIAQIVFNPKWHVPVRIKKLELDYELLAEPDYYDKHKYKVITNPDGTESVFQESGEQNALGIVKFNFPNPFGIFMHDTNQKDKFKQIIRTFSHGCIRLENPMEIAYFVLENTDGLTKEQVDGIRKSGKETPYDLKAKVP
ncbi:MAG: L,D-transpeptidase family protein, partial [Deltaproteobacteria bacterium]|nr:L,D-transpeptidase family protein [Deltaproteobacteria bacterium]